MLRLAIGLKAKAIGIVGLDCSLSNGEYSVYKGHSESETLENNPNAAMSRRDLDENDALVWHSVYARYFKKIHLKSNSGKRIYTIEPYFNTLRYIEDLLELQKPEIPIFNLSKNGAVISGAEYKTAKDFISKFQNEIIQNDYLDDVFINQSKRASIIKNDVKKLPKYLYELHNLSVKLLSILNNKKEYDLNKFHKKFIFLIKKHNVLIYLLRREVDYLAEDIRINTTAKVSDETLIFTFRRIAKITKELRNNLVKSLKNIDKL